jgi:hypothetical protein
MEKLRDCLRVYFRLRVNDGVTGKGEYVAGCRKW